MLLALAADFLFFTGFFASDDAAYLFGSRQLAEGAPLQAGLASARLGITLPDAAVYWVAGGEIAWVCWFHVLYHLGLVAVAFHLGRLIAGERAGLVAAMLTAAQPLFYVYAGAVLPDNAIAFWLGVLLIVLETVRQGRERISAAAAGRWYAAAGFLIGVGYSCKETALIMTIPSAICVIAAAPRLRSMEWIRNGAWMAGGLAAFFAIEGIALWALSGEPQWRLGFVAATSDRLDQVLLTQGVTPWDRFAYAVQSLSSILPLSLWGLVAACVVYALVRRRNAMLLVFFWWSALYLTVGTTSFTDYRPQTIQARYYSVALLPALVIGGILLVRLHDRLGSLARTPGFARGRALGAALSLIVGVMAIYELAINTPRAGNIYWAPFARGYAEALEIARDDYPQYPVVTESFYRTRMRPLLFPRSPEWLRQRSSFPEKPPVPPFLFLERVGRSRRGDHGGKSVDTPAGRLRVDTLRTHYPPETRLDSVRVGLGRIFGTEPGATVPLNYERGGVAFQLVTLDQPPAVQPELFALDASAALEPLADGVYHVSWGDPALSTGKRRRPAFYLQTFDRLTFRKPAAAAQSRFAAPVPAFSVDAGFRLVRGRRVELKVHVYGYQSDGTVVEQSREIEASTDGDKVVAHLELSGADLVAYKVRTNVITSRATGGLHVFPPVVRTPGVAGSAPTVRP